MHGIETFVSNAGAWVYHAIVVTGNLMVAIGGDLTNWGNELLKMISGL